MNSSQLKNKEYIMLYFRILFLYFLSRLDISNLSGLESQRAVVTVFIFSFPFQFNSKIDLLTTTATFNHEQHIINHTFKKRKVSTGCILYQNQVSTSMMKQRTTLIIQIMWVPKHNTFH